jgi:hypothetical protein
MKARDRRGNHPRNEHEKRAGNFRPAFFSCRCIGYFFLAGADAAGAGTTVTAGAAVATCLLLARAFAIN